MSTATAELMRDELAHTQLLDEREVWRSPDFIESAVIDESGATGGLIYARYAGLDYPAVPPVIRFWTGSDWQSFGGAERRLMFFVRGVGDFVKLAAPNELAFTLSPSAPRFVVAVGTGETISEVGASVRDLWRRFAASPAPLSLDTPEQLLDVPAALQQARSQAGLPVQDLAAMFGIGRRQFYNLVSGEQYTDDDRASRIARLTAAIQRVSQWVGGNSRKVRALLLARIDGDSIFDAAVADDPDRVDEALERAQDLAGQDTSLLPRLPPSQRATRGEAAAVGEYLRATRDETGASSE